MYITSIQTDSASPVSRVSIVSSIVLLLLAMMLPVCHMHSPLDKSAPDHCTICMTLHATPPLGVHMSPAILLFQTGKVVVASVSTQSTLLPHSASCRAPPIPAC